MSNRYWVDDSPLQTPFGEDTLGVVDENLGGVIAYFCDEQLATDYAERMEALEED